MMIFDTESDGTLETFVRYFMQLHFGTDKIGTLETVIGYSFLDAFWCSGTWDPGNDYKLIVLA